MKQLMTRFLKRKWLVAVVGAVLALAIAGSAWAATTSGTSPAASSPLATATTTTSSQSTTPSPALRAFLNSNVGRRLQAVLNQSQNQTLTQRERQAVLNLIKNKMTAADQATFNQLVGQIKQDTTNLKTATSQLRTLIDKYLLPAGAGSTGISGTTTTTSPGV